MVKLQGLVTVWQYVWPFTLQEAQGKVRAETYCYDAVVMS